MSGLLSCEYIVLRYPGIVGRMRGMIGWLGEELGLARAVCQPLRQVHHAVGFLVSEQSTRGSRSNELDAVLPRSRSARGGIGELEG